STPGVRRRWSRRRSPARSTRRAPPWRACPRPVVPAISEPTPLSSGRCVPFRSGSWGGTGRSRAGRRRVPPTAPHGGVSSPPPPPTECRHATARPAWTTRPFGHPRDTASIPAGRGRPGRRSRAERPGGSLRQLRVERTRLGERRQHFGFGGGDDIHLHRPAEAPAITPNAGFLRVLPPPHVDGLHLAWLAVGLESVLVGAVFVELRPWLGLPALAAALHFHPPQSHSEQG